MKYLLIYLFFFFFYPKGTVGHLELKDKCSPFLSSPYLSPCPWLPIRAANRPGQGQNEGHTASKVDIWPDARTQPRSGLIAPVPVFHGPFHPYLPPILEASSSSRSHFISSSSSFLTMKPHLGCLLPSPPPLLQSCLLGEQEGGAQVRMDRDPPRGYAWQPPPSYIFVAMEAAGTACSLGSHQSSYAQAPPSLPSSFFPPRLLLGSTPRFLEGPTPRNQGSRYLSEELPPKALKPRPHTAYSSLAKKPQAVWGNKG